MRIRVVVTGLMMVLLLIGLAPMASAQSANASGKNCWGVVSAQRAQLGGLGDHSSDQAEPRAGLGNLSRDLDYDHISELGAFLAEVDGIAETTCG